MRSMLLLAVLASMFVAGQCATLYIWSSGNGGCSNVAPSNTFTLTPGTCSLYPVSGATPAYALMATCSGDTYTAQRWSDADSCAGLDTMSASRNASQAADTCLSVLRRSDNGVAYYAQLDCSSGAAVVAVSSMLLAVLAFAANRFTL